jgi:hypothetical protein
MDDDACRLAVLTHVLEGQDTTFDNRSIKSGLLAADVPPDVVQAVPDFMLKPLAWQQGLSVTHFTVTTDITSVTLQEDLASLRVGTPHPDIAATLSLLSSPTDWVNLMRFKSISLLESFMPDILHPMCGTRLFLDSDALQPLRGVVQGILHLIPSVPPTLDVASMYPRDAAVSEVMSAMEFSLANNPHTMEACCLKGIVPEAGLLGGMQENGLKTTSAGHNQQTASPWALQRFKRFVTKFGSAPILEVS